VAIITTLCVLRFPEGGGEAFLDTVHPGHTVDEVLDNTGWDLSVSPRVRETSAPSAAEITAIRRFDPLGFWTRGQ
jgi:glutaconate CoA-transferase, subunit B